MVLCTHTHTALFGVLSTSCTIVIRSVFVKLVPAVCLWSWCAQRLLPTVCLIIAECSALNTCGIFVICIALALSGSSTQHTWYAWGVRPATTDVCSAFSLWCQLWVCVCQALSHFRRQHFTFKVCPAPVRFGICSAVSARTGLFSAACSVFWSPWCDQCSQQTSGMWPELRASAVCGACSGLSPGHHSVVPLSACFQRHVYLLFVQPPVPDLLLTCCVLCDCSPWCGRYQLPDAFAIHKACCTAPVLLLLFSLCSVPDTSPLPSCSMLCVHC